MGDQVHLFDARRAFDAIEAERMAFGYSQAELTRAADINPSTYTTLLNFPDRTPHRRTIRKLRNGLDLLANKSVMRMGAAE